jgi:AcrR family transcriptional regulator
MSTGESSRRRPRAARRDAVENREKVLRTAADLIAVSGHNVPLTEIADAAGVGVGTFYRSFPDRAALLEELQRRGYELLLATLARVKADGLTGADAIEAYLQECLTLANQLVAMPLRGAEPLADDAAVEAKARIGQAINSFLAEGRADGSVYADVAALDVIVCGTLIALPLPHGPDWEVTAQRHLALFIRGIRKQRGQDSGARRKGKPQATHPAD